MTILSSTETYSSEGPQCPYCGRQYTADEPGFYDEQRYTEEDCDNCGRKFSVSVNHSTTWTCEAISSHEEKQG